LYKNKYMGQLKNYFDEYLSSEEFDLMFDDEYEMWLNKEKKYMDKNKKNIFLYQENVLPLQHNNQIITNEKLN
jgi:hypothetical protein